MMNTAKGVPEPLRLEKAIYGGDCLAHDRAGTVVLVSFALPGELVEVKSSEQPVFAYWKPRRNAWRRAVCTLAAAAAAITRWQATRNNYG